jgi:mannose-6-phosphate isomerase-like protein (cupin superfamily)
MSGGYAVAQLSEIEELDDGRASMRPVRHHLGITAFGVNAWTAKTAGDRIINEHEEAESDGDTQEELYIVQSGRARFEIDGESVDAPAGSFVFVKPNTKRTAFAEEAGTTIVAIGGTSGQAYESFGWEIWMPVHRLYLAGDYEGASDRGREAAESGMPYAGVFYNLACCESLAGRTDDAIDHLGRSIEMSDRFRGMAKEDSDFDPIRSEPAFEELVAG